MARLALARDEQIDAIYRESHAVWGAGLSLEGYVGLWRELAATPWGSRHARFWVWAEPGGEPLSSVKVYRPELRILGHRGRASVFGAVFTPFHQRGRGHAASMVEALLDRAESRGELAALLFSDIGTDYYARMGFVPLPAAEQRGNLPRRLPWPSDWTLRPMEPRDLGPLIEAHSAAGARRPVSVIRDPDHWRFLAARSTGFFRRLGDPTLRSVHSVAERDGEFVGYLLAVEGRGEWTVREVGAVGGDPELAASVLCLGARDARRRGLRGFYGWLPPDVLDCMPRWGLERRPRDRAVPMIRPLDGRIDPAALKRVKDAYLPFHDQF